MKRSKFSLLLVISIFLAACAGQSFGGSVPQSNPTLVPGGHAGSSAGATAQGIPTATPPDNSAEVPTASSSPTLVPPATSYLPLPTSLPTYTPTPGAAQQPTNSGNIVFPYGTTAYTVVTDLSANAPQTYSITAQAGQALYIMQNGSFSVQLFDPGGNALTGPTTQTGPYGVGLPSAGAYTLQLTGSGHAVMTVHIPPAGQNQIAVPYGTSRQRVSFAPGTTGATLNLNLSQGVPQALVLHAGPDRRMLIDATGDVTVALASPAGQVVVPVYSPGHWEFPLTTTGDYTVILLGLGPVTVTTTIPVPGG